MSIKISRSGPTATITLDRPEVRNAFDAATVAALHDAFVALADDPSVRVAVLTGAGDTFCAGGDLGWMREGLTWRHDENVADAERLAAMFEAAWRFPRPLIGRVQGAAIGGGAGLVACCDLAVAADDARFGFGEVKLGLVPAVIARHVVPKIGVGHARALFVSGERFSAQRAFDIGLVHGVVPLDELDSTVASLVGRCLSSAPGAVAIAKQIVDAVWELERDAAREFCVAAIAAARAGDEAREGVRAFLEKRPPSWAAHDDASRPI